MNEKKIKMLVWEGWKKELLWIFIFACILLMSYGYYTTRDAYYEAAQKVYYYETYCGCNLSGQFVSPKPELNLPINLSYGNNTS